MTAIKFIKPVVLQVYVHDSETGADHVQRRVFLPDSTFQLGEFSEINDETACLELVGVGVVEVPNSAWQEVPGGRQGFYLN
ncbi:MAG: hypothetical protein AB7K24_14385 [Gemmataceae bacterium]